MSSGEEATVKDEFEVSHIVFRCKDPAGVHAAHNAPVNRAKAFFPGCLTGGFDCLGEEEGISETFD